MSIQDAGFVLVSLAAISWPAASLAQQPPITSRSQDETSRSQLLCHSIMPRPRLGNRGNSFRLELRESCVAVQENNPSVYDEPQSDGVTRNPEDARD